MSDLTLQLETLEDFLDVEDIVCDLEYESGNLFVSGFEDRNKALEAISRVIAEENDLDPDEVEHSLSGSSLVFEVEVVETSSVEGDESEDEDVEVDEFGDLVTEGDEEE